MNKKEKYINFIVDDLINKTKIDYEMVMLEFPFYFKNSAYIFPYRHYFPTNLITLKGILIEKYGAHDGELSVVWLQYKKRIKELIDNNYDNIISNLRNE